MEVLHLPPDQDGYQLREPSDRVLRLKLGGGQTRARVDQINSWKEVTCNWTVNRSQYLMLTSFYETAVAAGVKSFVCKLVTDHPVASYHECQFLDGSKGLGSINGLTYRFTGQLAVRPKAVDHELNRIRLKRYEENRHADLLNLFIKPVAPVESLFDFNYRIGTPYSLDFTSLFSNPDALTLHYTSESLPSGLFLNPITGILSGTPTGQEGIVQSTIKVSHRLGETLNQVEFTIRPSDAFGIAGHEFIPPMTIGSTFIIG